MMRRIVFVIGALCALAAAPAFADVVADCAQVRDGPLRVRACSQVIAGASFSAEQKALAYRNRGNARADAGALAEALADFSEAVRLQPADAASHAGRARARLALQDAKGAIADYTEALRLAPGNATYHVARGHAHFTKGDAVAAVADFSEALRLNPNSPSTLNRRGLAYRRAGDLARAIEDYSAAIAMNPVYALAYNNRGYVYESQGRKEEAVADFRAALLLDPSLIGARDGLRRLGIADTELAATQSRVEQGKKLVEQNCAACHAVGATGDSPNKKAPEFRTLHARHPNLALREPLTRGIAAPHDEMPRFTLSGPEIDSIVAYINSLSSSAPARRVPVAEAADAGDRRRGLAYARRHCASCHNIQGTDAPSPNQKATPFRTVANTPGMSVTALTVWSRTTHPTMPNFVMEPRDMDDLIAYILSLREAKP
jgi:tetratricopeptide (TPR) repeat protein